MSGVRLSHCCPSHCFWSSAPVRRALVLLARSTDFAEPDTHARVARSRPPSRSLQAADFPLTGAVLDSPERAHVPARPRSPDRLGLRPRSPLPRLPAGSGAPRARPARPHPGGNEVAGRCFAVRSVLLGGEQLEILADLGPKPLAANSLQKLNQVLGALRVQPPRSSAPPWPPRLRWDRIALTSRMVETVEIPANQAGAQLTLRAQHGDIYLVLLQLAGAQDRHADMPITLAGKDILHRHSTAIARRVFSTGGRSFDLSVTVPTPDDLAQANRLLETLTAEPRPWTFQSCDLSLSLPGTWRAAINPRSGCYRVVTLSAPGVLVVLTELQQTNAPPGASCASQAGGSASRFPAFSETRRRCSAGYSASGRAKMMRLVRIGTALAARHPQPVSSLQLLASLRARASPLAVCRAAR